MIEWQEINDRARDGAQVLTFVMQAGVEIVRLAWWDDGEMWEGQGFDSQEEVAGWWSYNNSVGQVKLEGHLLPTHWAPFNPPAGVKL